MFLLVINVAAVLLLLSWYLSRLSLLSWPLSKICNLVTTFAAIVNIGPTLTTHIYSRLLSNQQSPDSILKTLYFALHVLETQNSPESVWKTAFAASLATSVGWNIVAFERWDFNVIAQLIVGISFGVNVGIAVGRADISSAGFIAFMASAIVIVSLLILDLMSYLFVNWIAEQVMGRILRCFREYFK
ncbi:hypothetical protein HOLleu_26796 [Holothuria leucospilota]|uniref:Uncharacterized protein n=1 Tax=Holothuria leucospilota TaxID=206669 RepID=A0A9Q1BPP0_HOLLE|nr:hypothetical protein HOLleu_26796 [Holothuria leucospilota]